MTDSKNSYEDLQFILFYKVNQAKDIQKPIIFVSIVSEI